MDVNQQQSIIALNQLIEVGKDGELACMTGAGEVRDAELRDILTRTAESYRASVHELQLLVSTMGGKPSDGGSLNGKVYRAWMTVRHMLSPENDDAVLGMCEHEEDAARREYQSVMVKALPPETSATLQRQYDALMRHHQRLHAMRGMQVH